MIPRSRDALRGSLRQVLTILEVSNFTQARSTVRRRAGAGRVRWVIVAPGDSTWTQAQGRELLIEHVQGRQLAGADERVLLEAGRLRELVQLHRPGVIVCGSPALMPALVHLSGLRLDPRPALVGAWHADVSGQFLRRELGRIDDRLARVGARALGWWIKQGFGSLDAVFVGNRGAARELWARGLDRIYYTPRGVDLRRFSPQRRSPTGSARMSIWVEACSRAELDALPRLYAALCRRLDRDPALTVHAPASDALDRFAAAHAHVQLQGFANTDADTRAATLAACDLAVALPGHDGGWMACAEAMACGVPVLGVGDGVAELLREAGCGRGLADADPERIAVAVAQLRREAELAQRGRAGRRCIERYELDSCEARELACYEEVLEHVRSARRIPAGIHERMQASSLASAQRVGQNN